MRNKKPSAKWHHPKGVQRLRDIGEKRFLERLRAVIPRFHDGIGVGDDAAVLKKFQGSVVVCCDTLVENVDFAMAWAGPQDIGHKAAAVNLSDLAAMGAQPKALLAAIAVQPGVSVLDMLALIKAIDRCGRRWGAPLVGGDLSSTTGPLTVAVTAIGEVGQRPLRRYQAHLDDVVIVSGYLGSAAAGLRALQAGQSVPKFLRDAQLRPEPQIELAQMLVNRSFVHSCLDVSDGIASDALGLLGPRCGVEIDVARLPIHAQTRRLCQAMDLQPEELALAGGEDFGLLFSVAPHRVQSLLAMARRRRFRITPIGRIVGRSGVHVLHGPTLAGFDHFRTAQ